MTGPVRKSPIKRLLAAITVFALLIAMPVPAHAEPQWLTDLKAKAERYKRELREAVERLKAAAANAADRLDALAKQRVDELIALLEDTAAAAERVIKDNGARYQAIATARLAQAEAVARDLEQQLAEVIARTRSSINVDRRRLLAGSQVIVTKTLSEAGAMVSDVHVADDEVVAAAKANTTAQARRWGWLVGAGGGVVVMAFGVGWLMLRRRRSDNATGSVARRVVGGLLVVAGATGTGIAIWRWSARDSTSIVLGSPRCTALVPSEALLRAGRATMADRNRMLATLADCALISTDTTTGELIADRMQKLRHLGVIEDRSGPP